jgi:hypothetical protein
MNSSILLDSDLLRTFLAVARHGNVTRGAETLNRTQSAVSIQIKRLEERLAVPLFRREARGVSLTEAGAGPNRPSASRSSAWKSASPFRCSGARRAGSR